MFSPKKAASKTDEIKKPRVADEQPFEERKNCKRKNCKCEKDRLKEKRSEEDSQKEDFRKEKKDIWTVLDAIGISPPKHQIHIGMRIFKTGLAIFSTTLIYMILGRTEQSLFLALIAASVAMQGTVENSLRFGVQRLLGTALGGLLGIMFVWLVKLFPVQDHSVMYALFLSFMAMLAIIICVWLNLKQASLMAMVVLLAILINQQTINSISYALNRILDTGIGVLVSIVVNLSIRPPKWGNDD